MPFSEFTDQPPVQYSNLTGFVGFRFFKVWGVSRNQIIEAPHQVTENGSAGGVNLPAYDSPWPGADPNIGATLEQWSVVTSGDMLHATAIYSDRRTRGEFTGGFQTQTEEIEYAYRTWIVRPVVLAAGAGGTIPVPASVTNAQAWYTDTIVRYSTWFRVTVPRYVQIGPQQFQNPLVALQEPIARQVNRLHQIGSTTAPLWARFEGGDIQQLTWDRYRINYSWTVEQGVRWPGEGFSDILQASIVDGQQGALDAADYAFPRFRSRLYQTGSGDPGDRPWLRPPFERVRSVPRINVEDPLEILPPLFWAYMDFEPDPFGHVLLPGM